MLPETLHTTLFAELALLPGIAAAVGAMAVRQQ